MSYPVYLANGACKLLRVQFLLRSAWTASATNYWTIEFRIRREDQTIGELVGSYDLSARSLSAGQLATVYDDANGLAMSDGDLLVVSSSSTGSPSALDGPFVFADVQRNVR